MIRLRPKLGSLVGLSLLLGLALGCDDPVEVGGGRGMGGGRGASSASGGAGADSEEGEEAEAEAEVTVTSFRDSDFVEVDITNRDPFRGFAQIFKVTNVRAPQRRVLLPTIGVDDMYLIAIISGVAQPRAMVRDPEGVGHVIKRGDYIGRPEVIQTGGAEGMPVTLNWKVDRIRPNEVVLTREDPTAPERQPLTRIIVLHDDAENPALGIR